eukprot:g60735.t1
MYKLCTGDVQALYWRLLEGKGLPEKCDVHTVTNVVKPLLSGLPETLLTRALYAKFMSLAPKAGEREEGSVDSHRKLDGLIRQLAQAYDNHRKLDGLIRQLPTLNRLLLGRLMRLAADIAANEAKNSMTASSMGVLLGPCILLSDDPFELRNLKKTAIPALMVIIHQTIAGAVFSQAEMDQDIDEVREDLASERHPENLVNALRGKKSIFDCLQLQLQGGDEPLLPDMRSSSALIAGKPEVRLAALLGIAQNKAVGSSLAVCNPNTLDGLDHKSLLGMESLPDQSVLDQWKAGKEVLCTFKLEGHDLKKYLEALPVDAVLTGLKVVREKVDEGSFLVTQVVLNGCELDLSPQEKHHLESMDSTAKLVETKESSDSEEDTEKKLTRVVSSSTSTDKLPSKEQTANLDPQRQPIIISISLKGAHGEMGGYPDVRRLPEYTETKVTLLDAVTGFVAAREKKVENKVGPAEKVSDTAEKSGQVKEGADMGEKKVEEVKEGKDKVTAVSAESDQPDLRKPSRSSTVGSDGIDSLLHHSPTEPITSISAADLPMSSSFSVDEPDRTGFPSSSSTSTSEDEDHAEHTGAASSSSSSSPSASTQHARS